MPVKIPVDTRTYRQIAEQDYGILMCSGEPCKKKWNQWVHLRGRTDRAGVVHLARADNIPRRSGVRAFLILVGRALHREWESLPKWEQIHAEESWAWYQARDHHHTKIKASASADRRRVALGAARRSGAKLRSTNFSLYQWARRGYTEPNSKKQKSRS